MEFVFTNLNGWKQQAMGSNSTYNSVKTCCLGQVLSLNRPIKVKLAKLASKIPFEKNE